MVKTTNKLEEIKERFNNSTSGQWKVYEKEEGTFIGTSQNHPQLQGPAPVVVLSHWAETPHKRVHISTEDAEFIAHSKEDLEWLIQQVEKLQALIQKANEEGDVTKIAKAMEPYYEAMAKLSESKDENEL